MSTRFFNVAGPCVPGEHYMLDAGARCADLVGLIERKQFFVIHAARQTGKTTLLNDLEQELNAGTDYHALYCSLESVQAFTDPEKGIRPSSAPSASASGTTQRCEASALRRTSLSTMWTTWCRKTSHRSSAPLTVLW